MGRGFFLGYLFIVSFLFRSARAVDILDTAENIFFSPEDQTRIGIEIEIKGLSLEHAAAVVAAALKSRVRSDEETVLTTLAEIGEDGKPKYRESRVKIYVIDGIPLGRIVVKHDSNQVSDRSKVDPKMRVVELVTEPIRYEQAPHLQRVLDALKAAGAEGTSPHAAVSIQVNVEMGNGRIEETDPQVVVNLLRSYLSPKHRDQIEAHLRVPAIRRKYLQPFSPGFMAKLLDPEYHPTFRTLFDDYIYRQSLELLGDERAWRDPIRSVRGRLLSHKNPIVPQVVKLNPIRISSLLMLAMPEDPMTQLYQSSGWAVARPLIEFREWNNHFNVISCIKQGLGLVRGAKTYGYYDHDSLLSRLSGIDEEWMQKLREKVNQGKREGPIIVRYFLGDPQNIDRSEYENLLRYYRGTLVGFLPANEYGRAPVVIPGESVVFHRRHIHRYNLLGKYNPGLINANIQQALENKYVESLFWKEYAPDAMPKTLLLSELLAGGRMSVSHLLKQLSERFPTGWVIKGVWDLGSEKSLITDGIDIAAELESYKVSDFDLYRKRILRDKADFIAAAPEYLQDKLKAHSHYLGWRIHELLRQPHLALVQERVSILREFRVEVIGGRVLGGGSTLDRWWYLYHYGLDNHKKKDYQAPPQEFFERVEKFAQEMVNQLPPELRGTPFGMDIAVLEDGTVKMIESNPGGNSNFLFEEERESILALMEYLHSFPSLAKEGKVHLGLSSFDQMAFLMGRFKKWGVDPGSHYPGMEFLDDRIRDRELVQIAEPEAKDYQVQRADDSCAERLASSR